MNAMADANTDLSICASGSMPDAGLMAFDLARTRSALAALPRLVQELDLRRFVDAEVGHGALACSTSRVGNDATVLRSGVRPPPEEIDSTVNMYCARLGQRGQACAAGMRLLGTGHTF